MRHAFVAFLFLASACGGSGSVVPSPTLISVGGTYATEVAIAENACGPVTVQANPTIVSHTPGATRLTLTHAGLSYAGTLAADATFTTDPLALAHDGDQLALRIAGRFTLTGLEALVTVDVLRPSGASCRYTVRWTGTKQGPPNVLP